MKKLLVLISILVLTLLLNCVAFNKALAAEDTWYAEAAARAGNKVLLEDEEYYQGISLNSHIISDLTFMEIPFQDYVDGNKEKVQIITFAEALYRKSDEIVSEVVMYVYYPTGVALEFPKIWVDLEFTSQVRVVDDLTVDVLAPEDKGVTYNTLWGDISKYGHIVKYSGGVYQKGYYQKKVNKWLLNDYKGNSELQSIFDARITEYEYRNSVYGSYTVKNDDSETYYQYQNFQFITAKNNALEAVGYSARNIADNIYERVSVCLARNIGYVKVKGETVKYRYLSNLIFDFPFITSHYNNDYTDFYYLFFNVYDAESGKEWSSDKVIKEVTVDYLVADAEYVVDTLTTVDYGSTDNAYYTLNVLDKNGAKKKTYTGEKLNIGFDSVEKHQELRDEMTSNLLENISDTSLYHRDTVTPEKIEFQYLANTLNNMFVAFTAGQFNQNKISYLTLFNTKSEEFKAIAETSSDHKRELIDQYNYGMILGNKNGYPVNIKMDGYMTFGGSVSTKKETYTLVAAVGLLDVAYAENGEIFRVSVSESDIDNSQINNPQRPDDDPFYEEPGDDKPKDTKDEGGFWAWIQKIIEFFTITLPQWWEDNYVIVIGVVVVVVVIVGVILLVKLVKNWRTERMLNQVAQNQIQQNNQQQQQQQQQKPKRKRKRTNKKKE